MKKILIIAIMLMSITSFSQNLSVVESSEININDLPEYVIITSENTKLLGGIGISIDSKKSKYQSQLETLESLLQNRKKLHIRNQTDLLNALSKLGFEYLNAYVASSGSLNTGDSGFSSGSTKSRVNMVFRKKEKFRS